MAWVPGEARSMHLSICAHFSARKEQGRRDFFFFLLRAHYERQSCFRRLTAELGAPRERCHVQTDQSAGVCVGGAGRRWGEVSELPTKCG